MAFNSQPLTLMNIPLEVRHQIFKYVAMRDTKPEKVLRYWFEKEEVKEKAAELAAQNPNAEAPRVIFEGDQYEHEYESGDGDRDGDQEGEEDSNDEDEDEENRADDNGQELDGDDDEAQELDAEMDEADSTVSHITSVPTILSNAQGPATWILTNSQQTSMSTNQFTFPSPHIAATVAVSQAQIQPPLQNITQTMQAHQAHLAMVQEQENSAVNAAQSAALATPDQLLVLGHCRSSVMAAANSAAALVAQASATSIPVFTSIVAKAFDRNSFEDKFASTDVYHHDGEQQNAASGAFKEGDASKDQEENDNENDGPDSPEASNEDNNEEMAEEDSDANITTRAARSSPLVRVITAHRKWRHIPQFMQITHCPPPVELLLTSKQLNNEVKSWFYGIVVLRIEATGSFVHTSFFEEAFSQLTEATFSPIKYIRKVEVTFVWDTTWLRSDQAYCADVIFPALLRQRAVFVVQILTQAPNLSEVIIHWHDSAQDNESVDFMNDVLIDFLGLDAQVKVKTHYIAVDAKPYRRSIAGRRRVEFQSIINNGLGCLL